MNSRLAIALALPLVLSVTLPAHAALPKLPGQPETAPAGTVAEGSVKSLPPELMDTLPKDANGNLKVGEAQFHEEDAQRFSNYRSYLLDSSATQGKIKVGLANIEKTALSQFLFEGIIPGGPTRDGPWTDVTRVFQRPDGYAIFLAEFDFVAEGGSIIVMKELINAKVGASSATLSVEHSGDGRAITELTWQTKRKLYSLKTWGDLMHPAPGSAYDQKWLLGIAEGLVD